MDWPAKITWLCCLVGRSAGCSRFIVVAPTGSLMSEHAVSTTLRNLRGPLLVLPFFTRNSAAHVGLHMYSARQIRRLARTCMSQLKTTFVWPSQSWTWIGSIHGLDWIGLDWVRWLQSSVFFIYIFSILTTDKRWRCNTIMCILADFNRLWLDCEIYNTTLRLYCFMTSSHLAPA